MFNLEIVKVALCNIFVHFINCTRISELITLRSFRRDPFLQVVVGIDTDARCLDKVPSGRRDHLRRTFSWTSSRGARLLCRAGFSSLIGCPARGCQMLANGNMSRAVLARGRFDDHDRQPISAPAIDRPLANLRELSRTLIETLHCLRT